MVFLSSVSPRLVSLSFLLLLLSYSATASSYPRRTYSRRPTRFAEELIRDLNLLPRIPEAEADGEAGVGDPSSPCLVERRLDLPILGDIGSEIPIEQLGHHAGYYRLEHTHAAKMFYFFFESRGKSSDPVVIWLTGGPGCSSELALFYENGPFKIADNMSLIWNDYGWDKTECCSRCSQCKDVYCTSLYVHGAECLNYNTSLTPEASNLIFVDQPTGTGFSYSTDLRDIRYGEKRIADDLYDFLQAFFKEHQDYLKNDFYITGESYAGHYIPAAAERVYRGNKEKQGFHINLKGFAIGNGLTDPATQYGAYGDYALDMGIISKQAYTGINKIYPLCNLGIKLCGSSGTISCIASYIVCNSIFTSILLLAGDINYYDIRRKCEGSLCYDFSNMEKFLNDKSVRKALGVGDRNFVSCNPLVYEAMLTDWMKNLEVGIPALVDDGIKLLVYAGEYDLICNWLGNFRWVNSMEWSGHQIFAEAPMSPFTVDGKEAGLLKAYGPLSFLKVHDAGHMVPMDQPRAALEMLKRWMNGSLTEEWKFSAVADA